MKIGLFSFFSGAGFLDLGFEVVGFDVCFVNEYHGPFLDAYKYSRKSMGFSEPEFGYSSDDVSSFLYGNNKVFLEQSVKAARKKYDLIGFVGGPPCPDFSVGGKNRGESGDNGKLSAVYVELIKAMKPDFFLFENVKGLWRTTKHRTFFDRLKLDLVESDYILTNRLINALEFGAPQFRERIILIGFNRKKIIQAKNTSIDVSFPWDKFKLFNEKTIMSLPWPQQSSFQEGLNVSPPQGILLNLTVEFWFNKNQVLSHPNSAHFFTPRAGLKKFLSVAEGDDSKKSYKRLHRWRYSPTAAYGNNEVHLHPYLARRLSVSEALAIQSLPPTFSLPESMSLSNMFKTIGNGVPFKAAEGLAKSIDFFLQTK